MKHKSRLLAVLGTSLAIILLTVQAAYAITITVDGTRESAWDGDMGQLPGIQSDPDESGITDGYDVEEFRWTNDATNMYFLMDTYASTIWTGNPAPTLVICINLDNNTATGGSYSNCNNMTGIDRSIVVTRYGIDVYDGDPNTGTLISATTQDATSGDITEVSIDLASLGIGSTFSCIQGMPAAIYFDNGIGDPDDHTPDTGLFTIGCGSPTSITISESNAQPSSAQWVTPAIGIASLVNVGVVALVYKRRKTKA
jgi:hypothetical protein